MNGGEHFGNLQICLCKKYQPSGARGTRSPPETPQRLQNPKWLSGGPKMRKGNSGENGEKEKTDENSGHYVIASSRPPECRPLERRTLVPIRNCMSFLFGGQLSTEKLNSQSVYFSTALFSDWAGINSNSISCLVWNQF